jgi:hypothetical protein
MRSRVSANGECDQEGLDKMFWGLGGGMGILLLFPAQSRLSKDPQIAKVASISN